MRQRAKDARQKQSSGQSGLCFHTLSHSDTLLLGPICLHVQNSQGKMWFFTALPFIHTYTLCSRLNGRTMGFCRASVGLVFTMWQPLPLLCRSSKKIWALKLRDGSRALLAFITNLSLSSLFAPRLGSYCGIMDIPFLCLFSLEIFTHTKGTKWNASLPSQPTLFAPVPPYVLSLLGWLLFFTLIPQRAHGNQNHQCCISQAFFIGCKLW